MIIDDGVEMRMEYQYICPHCSEPNWRTYRLFMSMKCDKCEKLFTTQWTNSITRWVAKDKEEEEKAVKVEIPDHRSIDRPNSEFRIRADAMVDEFRPKTAYIYAEFCVFEFYSSIGVSEMMDAIKLNKALYRGLKADWYGIKVVVINILRKD